LGIIPQVVDTVIFIDKGEVSKVYDVIFTVKVPQGMVEQDLARPVITITDFETKEVEYEIYTYGEQVVVMPVTGIERERPATWGLAVREIEKELMRYTGNRVDVEIVSDSSAAVYMDEEDIAGVIGKGGKTIDLIEKKLGIHLDIRERKADAPGKERSKSQVKEIGIMSFVPAIERSKKYVILTVKELSGATVDVYSGDECLFTATVGKKGEVKIGKETETAFQIMENPTIVKMRFGRKV
jgi:ATPase